jgi:hypothetical protein
MPHPDHPQPHIPPYHVRAREILAEVGLLRDRAGHQHLRVLHLDPRAPADLAVLDQFEQYLGSDRESDLPGAGRGAECVFRGACQTQIAEFWGDEVLSAVSVQYRDGGAELESGCATYWADESAEWAYLCCTSPYPVSSPPTETKIQLIV